MAGYCLEWARLTFRYCDYGGLKQSTVEPIFGSDMAWVNVGHRPRLQIDNGNGWSISNNAVNSQCVTFDFCGFDQPDFTWDTLLDTAWLVGPSDIG